MNYNLGDSKVGSSRDAIKGDLVDKIKYDDPTVFDRLRVFDVDDKFVSACAASLKEQKALDIELLKTLAQNASKRAPDTLDAEEKSDKLDAMNKEERSGNYGSAEEKKMYNPLINLFTHIAEFDMDVRPRSRAFQKTNGMLKADEPHTFGFPSASPDITISPHGLDARSLQKWRYRDAFGEVKPSKKQGPKPANPGTIPDIVAQSADYARLFMSARPFMLFCIGILIFGTEFCVGIFDRDGITFSPIYDMFQSTETFVRVVSSIAGDLSMEDLGHDPTVRILADQETEQLTGGKKYPSAIVSPIGIDHRQWCTIGPPIWVSLSLLGRGTHVWRAREYIPGDNCLHGDEVILKTAWRSSARTPESDIYLSIDPPILGLAKFLCGGDVKFPGSAGYPITVQNLRNQDRSFLCEDDDNPTPVLHRLILLTVGRPMWEYKSDRELLTGFRDALRAHQELCNRNILHRDISAGNILLTKDLTAPLRGFITDLEFARIHNSTIQKPEVAVTKVIGPQNIYNDQGRITSRTETTTQTHIRFESTVSVKRGADMTGTAQFMSHAILLGIANGGKTPIVHKVAHDVESFIWVLSYCVLRNLYHRASARSAPQEAQAQSKQLRSLFGRAFSQVDLIDIAMERLSGCRALLFPEVSYGRVDKIVENFMTDALVSLFKDLEDLIECANSRINQVALTHDALLAKFENAISLLP